MDNQTLVVIMDNQILVAYSQEIIPQIDPFVKLNIMQLCHESLFFLRSKIQRQDPRRMHPFVATASALW